MAGVMFVRFVVATSLLLFIQCISAQSGTTSGSQFTAFGCATNPPAVQGDYRVLDASHSTPKDGYCRAISEDWVHSTDYDLHVELYNHIGEEGIDSGYPGVAYNVIDGNNFDVIYFRINYAAGCFQTAHVRNGGARVTGGVSHRCADGPLMGRTWFTVYVAVRDSHAAIYVNNVLIVEVTPHFRATGWGGVLAYQNTGHSNVIYFRNYEITEKIHPNAQIIYS